MTFPCITVCPTLLWVSTKEKLVQGIAVKLKLLTCSTLKGFSVMVFSPALSATIVSTHRFGRKTLSTLLMIDLSEAFCGGVTTQLIFTKQVRH